MEGRVPQFHTNPNSPSQPKYSHASTDWTCSSGLTNKNNKDINKEKINKSNRVLKKGTKHNNDLNTQSSSKVKELLDETSPIKSPPTKTCKDKTCKCYQRKTSVYSRDLIVDTNVEGGLKTTQQALLKNLHRLSLTSVSPIATYTNNSKELYSKSGAETLNVAAIKYKKHCGPHTINIQKDVLCYPKPSDFREGANKYLQGNHTRHYDIKPSSSYDPLTVKHHFVTGGETRRSSSSVSPTRKKKPRKTISLSTWLKRQEKKGEPGKSPACQRSRDSQSIQMKKIQSHDHLKNVMSIEPKSKFSKVYVPLPNFINNQNVQPVKFFRTSTTSMSQKQENGTANTSVSNDLADTEREYQALQTVPFVRNGVQLPVIFSTKNITISSTENQQSNNAVLSALIYPQPTYATYDPIPTFVKDPKKPSTPVYMLPYLIVPKTFTIGSRTDLKNDLKLQGRLPSSCINTPYKATVRSNTNGSISDVKTPTNLHRDRSSTKPLHIPPFSSKSAEPTIASERSPYYTQYIQPKKCKNEPKKKNKQISKINNQSPSQIHFSLSKTLPEKLDPAKQKMKFANSLGLMKKEDMDIGDPVIPVNPKDDCLAGKERITFVPAAQVKTMDTDSLYTLQVISLIKTQLEPEKNDLAYDARHNLGWTPASINKTAEGHINMVFAPHICMGLYLIEDVQQAGKTTKGNSNRCNVRLIPFSSSLEIPTGSLALALGKQDSTWGACVDFLKQIKPLSTVRQVVKYITGGTDCFCLSISMKGEKSLNESKPPKKKKPKYTSIALPKCQCCQCKPNSKSKSKPQ